MAPRLRSALLVAGLGTSFVARRRGRDLAAVLGSAAFLLGTLAATASSVYPVWLRSTIDPAYSLTAGGYLCNAAFYLARHALPDHVPCGFLHLPPTPDLACAAPPMEYARQKRALETVLSVLTRR